MIVEQYNGAVRLRNGIFKEVLTPGAHWKWPVIDSIIDCSIVPTTMRLPPQSLHPKKDGDITVGVVVEVVLKYRVSDVKLFLLGVNDAIDALADMAQGIVMTTLTTRTWSEIRETDMDSVITKEIRKEAKRWGIEVEKATITTLSETQSVRVIGIEKGI